MLPASDVDFEPSSQAQLEVSAELRQLLNTAEERVASTIQKEPEVNFEQDDVDPDVIPPEALAALARPLGSDSSRPRDIANLRLDPRSSRLPRPANAPTSSEGLSSHPPPTHGASDSARPMYPPASELPDELTRASGRPATQPPEPDDLAPHEKTASQLERPTVPPPWRQAQADSEPPSAHRAPSSVSLGTQVSSPIEQQNGGHAAIVELPRRVDTAGAIAAAAHAVSSRFSGALAFETEHGVRRVVLKDGDFVIAVSGNDAESLVSYLAGTGELDPEEAAQLAHRLPPFGRHTATALIARGKLKQEQLWPALRAHAEWLLGLALSEGLSTLLIERHVPERLSTEPTVFGGATGAEVLIDVVRRVVSPSQAAALLGGYQVVTELDDDSALLNECALTSGEHEALHVARGLTLTEAARRSELPDLATLLFALHVLGVVKVRPSAESDSRVVSPREPAQAALAALHPRSARPPDDPVEGERAQRARVTARKALVDQGDYFAVLGVSPAATLHEIERAYQSLKREFEPSRAITAQTLDLADDISTIVDVLDEAYAILQDTPRREAYRRAIGTGP
jgi:hypothetical protein